MVSTQPPVRAWHLQHRDMFAAEVPGKTRTVGTGMGKGTVLDKALTRFAETYATQ